MIIGDCLLLCIILRGKLGLLKGCRTSLDLKAWNTPTYRCMRLACQNLLNILCVIVVLTISFHHRASPWFAVICLCWFAPCSCGGISMPSRLFVCQTVPFALCSVPAWLIILIQLCLQQKPTIWESMRIYMGGIKGTLSEKKMAKCNHLLYDSLNPIICSEVGQYAHSIFWTIRWHKKVGATDKIYQNIPNYHSILPNKIGLVLKKWASSIMWKPSNFAINYDFPLVQNASETCRCRATETWKVGQGQD